MRHWHRVPREAVDAPSLKVYEARLDAALGSLVWWVAALPTHSIFEIPLQPKPF